MQKYIFGPKGDFQSMHWAILLQITVTTIMIQLLVLKIHHLYHHNLNDFLITTSCQLKSHCVLCNQCKTKCVGINDTGKNQYKHLHHGEITNEVMNQFHINVGTIINNMT